MNEVLSFFGFVFFFLLAVYYWKEGMSAYSIFICDVCERMRARNDVDDDIPLGYTADVTAQGKASVCLWVYAVAMHECIVILL